MSKRILVTGGAGFVGSCISIKLAESNPDWHVIALDNLKRRGSELNLQRLKEANVQFIHGDIRNFEDLDPTALAPDLIVECSAEPSVLAGYTSPSYMIQTNSVGTINCLELARQTKADFLFLSTSRVYPISPLNNLNLTESEARFNLTEKQPFSGVSSLGVSEEFPLEGSRSLYGATKLASELFITEYAEAYNLRTLINRCGVITGPWQMGKADQGVFALWMIAHYFQKSLKYIGFGGKGKQVRDFLHINDLIDLILNQIQYLDHIKGKTFNVGGGVNNSLSLLETTQLCREITGNQISIESEPEHRPGDIPIYITDIQKLTQATGWFPKRDAQTTLREIYDWIYHFEDQVKKIFL